VKHKNKKDQKFIEVISVWIVSIMIFC